MRGPSRQEQDSTWRPESPLSTGGMVFSGVLSAPDNHWSLSHRFLRFRSLIPFPKPVPDELGPNPRPLSFCLKIV